jgi:hypothetical protein
LGARLLRTLWRLLLIGWMRLRAVLRRFGGELFACWRVGLVRDRRRLCRISAVIAAPAPTTSTLAARRIRLTWRRRATGSATCDGRIYTRADRVVGAFIAVVRPVVGAVFVVGRRTHSARSCWASCAMSASIASCAFALWMATAVCHERTVCARREARFAVAMSLLAAASCASA